MRNATDANGCALWGSCCGRKSPASLHKKTWNIWKHCTSCTVFWQYGPDMVPCSYDVLCSFNVFHLRSSTALASAGLQRSSWHKWLLLCLLQDFSLFSMTNSKYRNYMEHHGTTEALHQNANSWDLRSSDKNTEYSDTFVHWPFVHVFAKSKLWNKRDLLPE